MSRHSPLAARRSEASRRSRPRLLFLNRSYYPDAEATGQLLTELCEDLAEDFDVTVIAGQPNHNALGVAFRRRGREVHNGVTIHRVWHTTFPKRSFVGKAINLLSYSAAAAWAGLTTRRPDVVIAETDPPLLCLLGSLLKRRFGCQSVAYLQDIYPDLGVAVGKLRDGWLTRRLRQAFINAYRRADRVVVLSDDMRKVLIDSDVDDDRIETVPNWVDCNRVTPIKQQNRFRQELGLDGKFVVMYSGNLGLCQDLETLILAAQQLRDRDDIVFVLVGDGASKQRLVAMAEERGLSNVRFVDYQPLSRLSESLSAADLHLIPVDPRVSDFLMPSKLYGALASGTPVLAIAPLASELARLVEQEQVGAAVEASDPHALAEKILWFAEWCDDLQAYGHRARQLALTRFDRRHGVDRFRRLLDALITGATQSEPAQTPPLEAAAID